MCTYHRVCAHACIAVLHFPAPRGLQVAEGAVCARWTGSQIQRWRNEQPDQLLLL